MLCVIWRKSVAEGVVGLSPNVVLLTMHCQEMAQFLLFNQHTCSVDAKTVLLRFDHFLWRKI